MKKLLLFTFALFLWTGAWADKTVWLNPGSFENSGTHSWDEAGAVMYSYVFNNGGHQWIKMTETSTINGVTCYKAEIDDTYTTLVLVRINPAYADNPSFDNDVKWAQTGDITLSEIADNTLFTITNWGSYSNTGVVNTYTAKFITNKNWTTTNAYAWSGDGGSAIKNLGDWGGTPMTQDGTYSSLGASSKIYSISFKAAPAPEKIIFNNGDNPGEEGNTKTADLTFVDGETYFLGTEENLAYGATVSWGDDANHTEAINGSAPLSNITDGNDATNVQVILNGDKTVMSVVLDLGEAKTFNSLLINQTGNRWNTSFQIYVSNDNSTWTEVTTNSTGIRSGRFIATFTGQTARYVKYYTTKANKNVTDEWGAGLAEIQLYNFASVPTVASIEMSASTIGPIIPGEEVVFTAVGSSSIAGIQIGLGTITWNNDNTAAGTIVDGTYTAIAAGTSEVSATYGGVTSNAISITVVNAVKIDLSTNNAYRIYPIEETLNNDKNKAFDSDAGSLWELHKSTAADESSRTYNTGFIADLGGEYDITSISIKFEGACSQTFGLAFAGTDGVFGENVYNGGHNATETHTEEFSGVSVTNARYVKFLSTKAQSQYGVKIYDFTIHGIEKSTVTDTTNPTIEAVSEGTKTHNSITLNVTGNDNDSKYLMYKGEQSGKTAWTSGAANTSASIIFEDLLPGKEYSFTITVYDSKGNSVSIDEEVSTTGDPLTLPVATKDEEDVKSIIGQYGKTSGYNVWRASEFAEAGWSHNALQTNGTNNNVEMTFTAKDVSDMDYLHLDVYAPSATPMCVFLQDGAWKGIDIDGGIPADDWKQIDIPMSFFKETCGRPMTALTNLLICKKVDNTTTHEGHGYYSEPYPYFIIGNIYFWKEPESIDPATIESVTVTAASTSIAEGKTTQLTVTDQLDRHVTNLMTFESDHTDVATVSAEGIVTAINPGTARITATVTGYEVSSYIDITVTEAPLGFDLTEGNHTIHVTPYHYVGTNNYKLVITSEETMTGMGGSFWNINGVGTDMRNNSGGQTYTVTDNKITITNTSTSAPNIYTPLYVIFSGEVNFGYVNLDWIDAQEVSISAAEWASFSSKKALDFGKVEGLKAYYATANDGLNISYNTIEKAPAETGVILGGEQGNYDVPVIDAAPALSSTNLLQSTADEAYTILAADENLVYVFGKIGSDIGFVKGNVGYVIGANKAYLRLTSELAAKGFDFIGLPGSETDGINKVNALIEDGVRYNLAGQRVGNDYKGIVIVNGKKYLRK